MTLAADRAPKILIEKKRKARTVRTPQHIATHIPAYLAGHGLSQTQERFCLAGSGSGASFLDSEWMRKRERGKKEMKGMMRRIPSRATTS